MPRFKIPNSASIHTARSFLSNINPFDNGSRYATLELHPRWAHVEPLALSMISAWGAWCRRNGNQVKVENVSRHTKYLARMKLFQHLGVRYDSGIIEHEEAGRFLPVTQVKNRSEVSAVIGDVSAMLHLHEDPESLAAVQYCVSELIRNVLEHSGSEDGAFVCAQRYTKKPPHRVTLAVADCGQGIAAHLGRVIQEAKNNNMVAIQLAMRPGITGAVPGLYGTPDNAGAGLFITRSIAKGTGGYFLIVSGNAAYRLRRTNKDNEQLKLFFDPFDDILSDCWDIPFNWKGTAVTIEIRTDRIDNYKGFFQWIFSQIPKRKSITNRIIFT